MKDIYKGMPSLAVASVALIVAASGTAGALAGKNSVDSDDLQKNVVTSKNVKNGSLKGGDLKKDSVSGKQIKESSLGTVPNAAAVDSLKFFDVTLVEGQQRVLMSNGTIAAVATCVANVDQTESDVYAATTATGATFAGDDDSGVLTPATPLEDRNFEDHSDSPGGDLDVSDGYDDQFWIRAANGSAIFGTVGSVTNADTNSCVFFGTYTTK